ncbi:MAG: alpha-1,2-fucosyltransferase [Phycisphaeraceae bacterium]|nr:alpha-1,2-fucosyltransferase [Phycisphaeraceae bacterium]
MIILTDSWGRLANQLTVLANLLIYAKRADSVLIDASFAQRLGPADSVSSILSSGVCMAPHAPGKMGVLDRLCFRLLRLGSEAASKTIDQQHTGQLQGLSTFSGKGDRNLSLDVEWVGGPSKGLLLTGIFFSTQNVTEHESKWVRGMLRPADWNERSKGLLLNTGTNYTIGVHVRHGDYKVWQNGQHYFTTGQYQQAMRCIQAQNTGATYGFLVVSDDAQVQHDLDGQAAQQWAGASVEDDLFLLANCDAVLATNTSFARWASFVGECPIILIDDLLEKGSLNQASLSVCAFPQLGEITSAMRPSTHELGFRPSDQEIPSRRGESSGPGIDHLQRESS